MTENIQLRIYRFTALLSLLANVVNLRIRNILRLDQLTYLGSKKSTCLLRVFLKKETAVFTENKRRSID